MGTARDSLNGKASTYTISAGSTMFKAKRSKPQCFKCNYRYFDSVLRIEGCIFPNRTPMELIPCDCNRGVYTQNVPFDEKYVMTVNPAEVQIV